MRRLDGISRDAERIRAFLIGQIGKNTAIANNSISLSLIFDEIYAVISAAQSLVGGRIIILECEDIPKLIKLYESHGYTLINIEGEKQPALRTLYTHITE